MVSPRFELFYDLEDLFLLIMETLSNFLNVLQTPINQLYSNLPNWVTTILNLTLGEFGNYTLLALMLGGGLTVYVVVSVVKYFTDLFGG